MVDIILNIFAFIVMVLFIAFLFLCIAIAFNHFPKSVIKFLDKRLL